MPHYFSEKQDSPPREKRITIEFCGRSVELFSASGIFSKDSLDVGSRLLIESSDIREDARVLDLGSGIGVVGIAIKMLHPSSTVLLADINERAVTLCKKNIALTGLEGIDVVKSDIYESISGRFDYILVNPPQSAGRKVCIAMIEGARDFLAEDGRLNLVARHNKGGSTLEKKMKEVFGNSAQLAKRSGFRVYSSIRRLRSISP